LVREPKPPLEPINRTVASLPMASLAIVPGGYRLGPRARRWHLCLGSRQRSCPSMARPDRAGRAVTALACRVLLLVIAVSSTSLTSNAQERTKDGSYKNEGTARTCIHTRLTELIAQNRPNIAGDTVLTECTKGLQVELKDRQKSYCEAVSYIGWLIADENSKLNGLKGQSYQPDKASIQRCEKTYTWEKHP
jgi:hypothetical protein